MKTRMLCGWLLAGVFGVTSTAAPEAWRLDPEKGWRAADVASRQDGHPGLLRVREAFATGDRSAVVKALEAVYQYPELAGGDLDAFLAAERVIHETIADGWLVAT